MPILFEHSLISYIESKTQDTSVIFSIIIKPMQGFRLHYRQYTKLHTLSIPLMCSCNTLIFVLPLCIQIATPQVDILYLLLYKFIYVSVNCVHKVVSCHVSLCS